MQFELILPISFSMPKVLFNPVDPTKMMTNHFQISKLRSGGDAIDNGQELFYQRPEFQFHLGKKQADSHKKTEEAIPTK